MDYEYVFRKICERRGVVMSKVESVAFNAWITFGFADGTYLLPLGAKFFYYLDKLNVDRYDAVGVPIFRLSPNVGIGGLVTMPLLSAVLGRSFEAVETNGLLYEVNSHSAGTFVVSGSVFKITYA